MIRIGILGAAGIAPQALITPARRRDDVTVQAVASRRPGAARAYATTHHIPDAHDSYEALLASDEVDLVYVALPPSEHVAWSIATLQAGKHVLCEKPIAMNAAEASQLRAGAATTGRHAIEAFHDHYHPLTAHLADLRHSGALGEIESITTSFTADNPYFPGSIRHVPALGGGALMDLGCYPVHWLRDFLGAEPAVTSAAYTAGPEGADESIDATLSSDGAQITLHASMATGVPFAAPFYVLGSRGSVHVDNLVLPHLGHSITTVLNGVSRTYTLGGRETYDHQLDAVVHALSADQPADTEGHDYVPTMAVIDAIYAAAGVPGRG